jgi:tripartite-type tricarboxylate transporter receptor subunit TctC
MTKALERAFKAAASLPDAEQDALAAAILENLAAEERWARFLAENPAKLERLADEALAEDVAGKTVPLDPDDL